MKNRYLLALAACGLANGLARAATAAPYSDAEFLRNTRNYTQNMLDDIRANNNRSSTFISPSYGANYGAQDTPSAPRVRQKTASEMRLEAFDAKLDAARADPDIPPAIPGNKYARATFYARYGIDYFRAEAIAGGEIRDAARSAENNRAATESIADERERQNAQARVRAYYTPSKRRKKPMSKSAPPPEKSRR